MNLRPRYPGQLRTTAVCLRPMTLRPHEDAMRCNAMQRGPGASGRAYWPVQVRGEPKGGDPRSPSPNGLTDRAHRFAQPANSYQQQKYSLAQDTPAWRTDDRRASPCEPVLLSLTCQKLEDIERETISVGSDAVRVDERASFTKRSKNLKARKIERSFHLEERIKNVLRLYSARLITLA